MEKVYSDLDQHFKVDNKDILEEINLNSTSAGDEGGAELFENMKLNKSLRRVYANSNQFYKNSMIKFGELLKKDNDDSNSEGGLEFLSLSYNEIDDECVNYFAQDLINYKYLAGILSLVEHPLNTSNFSLTLSICQLLISGIALKLAHPQNILVMVSTLDIFHLNILGILLR